MKTQIVASVAAATEEELCRLASARTGGADLVELRVDAVPRFSVDRLAALRALRDELGSPLILTCRSGKEGGDFAGSEEERLSLLRRAVELGFDYVDVEIASLSVPLERSSETKLVLSHHDFDGLPEDPERLVDRALELGADVVKLAARVRSLEETLQLAKWGERVRAEGKRFAPIPMGPAGTSGRILTGRLGGAFLYAPPAGARTTGPGQLSLEELAELYRARDVTPTTSIYGVVGGRALASLSPSMHNRWFQRIGRDAVYVPFEEQDLVAFAGAARRLGVCGLSVTIPFKERIVELVDELDETAARIGAVNTIVVRDGKWKGYNTDRDGVLEPLERFGELRGRRAIVLGAGGAARAATAALRERGVDVLVLARREPRAASLATAFGADAGPLSSLANEHWEILVNATPMGSSGSESPVLDPGATASGSVVFDMVTAPETTELIRSARERGMGTVAGLEMLAAQAAHQARLWTGELPKASELLGYARRRLPMARYSRQTLFAEIGVEGQSRIRSSSVVVVGAGALGSVTAEMLVRAGVGRLRLVDRDYVDASNLQRQSLYDERDVREGLPKAVAAARKLRRINSDVEIEGRVEDAHAGNVLALVEGCDLILDGTDNFETRYLLNDASVRSGIPWVYAACVGSYGMSFLVIPGTTPCLRCFLEEEPAPGTSPTCDTAGVIAPAVHAVSAFQVTEALKLLAGRHEALTGAVLSVDVWRGTTDSFRPGTRRADCPACGRGTLEYLTGSSESRSTTLCGRNAVQVRPARPSTLSLDELSVRLRSLGEVTVNPYLLRFKIQEPAGREMVLFADGRAIVHGTEDPAEARSLYARFVGN